MPARSCARSTSPSQGLFRKTLFTFCVMPVYIHAAIGKNQPSTRVSHTRVDPLRTFRVASTRAGFHVMILCP